MTTRRRALGGLALLLAGPELARAAPRDGSRGWRIELRSGRGQADADAALALLTRQASGEAAFQRPPPQVARHGRLGISLIWPGPIEPTAAEAFFDFLPRFGVFEVQEVPPAVSYAFRLPGDRITEPEIQPRARLFDGHDLETARVSRDRLGLPTVVARWTPWAAYRARRYTPRLLGHRVMFWSGGPPLSAPLIVGPFRRNSEIGGLFTPESAAAVARAFNEGAVLGRLRRVSSRPLRSGE